MKLGVLLDILVSTTRLFRELPEGERVWLESSPSPQQQPVCGCRPGSSDDPAAGRSRSTWMGREGGIRVRIKEKVSYVKSFIVL